MIINAKFHNYASFRQFSVKGAIAYWLKDLPIDEHLHIHIVIDYNGKPVGVDKIRMNINQLQATFNARYLTRETKDYFLVIRIA